MAVLPRRRRLVAPVLALLLVASAGGRAPAPALAQERPAGVGPGGGAGDGRDARLALRADGTVWGWGTNSDWELGVTTRSGPGSATPVQATGLDQVRAIATGDDHGLALRADGTRLGLGQERPRPGGRPAGGGLSLPPTAVRPSPRARARPHRRDGGGGHAQW